MSNNLPPSVSALIGFEISGNIIPMSWFQNLKHKDGKPNLAAIVILADLVYWHRPVEIRDETTGRLLGYQKKFQGDKLQRSNNYYEDLFGLTKKQTRDAINFLAEEGLVEKIVRRVAKVKGLVMSNVQYVEIVPDQLKNITLQVTPSDLQVTPSDAQVAPSLPVGQTYTETLGDFKFKESADAPPSPAKKSKPVTVKPAGVLAYFQVTGRYPRKETWELISQKVGDAPPDLAFWREVITNWMATPWSKTNIAGMLDHFTRRELPSTRPKTPPASSFAPARNSAAKYLGTDQWGNQL